MARRHGCGISRRSLLLAAGSATIPAASRPANAQAYPSRPVRWIVPFPAGGPSDILARIVGQELSDRLGQPVVIENRPGASGNVGTQAVVSAPPDGHTLLLAAAPNAINVTLYPNLGFNFIGDTAPVASIARGALIMLVAPSLPTETIAQFIAYAKANPGKINMASPGNGTPPHVAGELFKTMTGVQMLHVPYRGVAPAITDLLSGEMHVMFDPVPSSIGHVRSGKLRALAVTTRERSELLPDTPAIAETVPHFEASTWFGVAAPRQTPAHIIEKLNGGLNMILTGPPMKARLADLGATVFTGSAGEFAAFIRAETDKWGDVVRRAGIRPE